LIDNREGAPLARIIVADDEESMRYYLKRTLSKRGFEVETATKGDEAIRLFEARSFDLAILDLKMPGADGIEVLRKLRDSDPEAMAIIMTAYGTVRSAVDAMKIGAFDYITKPFETDELLLLIDRALDQRATLRENRELRQMVDNRKAYAGLIGQSPAMRAVYQTIDLLRESTASALITGESGTGKELVAHAIHLHSKHHTGKFVPLNCAALPENLLESELFGHDTGAFTGAVKTKRGLVETADNGTLFLDEISELQHSAQAKLLRFLQEKEFIPLGTEKPVKINVRIIAASNRNLEDAVKAGEFREDLYWRLNVVPVHLPPLRDRKEDIPVLASHFLDQYSRNANSSVREFTVDAMIILTNYQWPGNVRELQNTMERMVVLHSSKHVIDSEELPEVIRKQIHTKKTRRSIDSQAAYQDALRSFEADYLTDLFKRTNGNVSKAAQIAGISRQNLHRKIKQLDIDPDEFRN